MTTRKTTSKARKKPAKASGRHPPPRRTPEAREAPIRPLAGKQKLFADEYLVDLNATQAYIRAGYIARGNAAEASASKLLRHHKVAAYIAERMKDRAERLEIKQDDVLRRWWTLAQADARDLTEYRRCACRFCWGHRHAYQWTTKRAYEMAVADAVRNEQPPPTCEGGFGYTENKQPNDDCPECFGRGRGTLIVKDTRDLSPGATLLFAGVKLGKEGIEVKMESRADALVNVAKHMGMLDPKLTLKGDKKNPLVMLLEQIGGTALGVVADDPAHDGEDDE